jgi:hypothetical protein
MFYILFLAFITPKRLRVDIVVRDPGFVFPVASYDDIIADVKTLTVSSPRTKRVQKKSCRAVS